MTSSILLLIFLCLCAGLAGWLLFIWAVRSGQFDDLEGPKYRMMHDEDEFPDSEIHIEDDDHSTVDESARNSENHDPGGGKKGLP